MNTKMYLKAFLLSSIILTTGCSDNGVLFRSVGSYDVSQNKGVYLIEKPYEINGVTYTPKEDYNYFDSGDAFWYAYDKNRPLTANGERNDPTRFTAIHRTLPLPSIVRITNLNNDMSVLARVNDRGPYDNSRLIDVSQSVAEYLNFSKTSVTPVQVEVMVVESKELKERLQKENQSQQALEHHFESPKSTTKGGEVVMNADDILYPGMKNKDIQKLKVGTSAIPTAQSPKPTSIQQMQTTPKTTVKAINTYNDESFNNNEDDNDIIYSGSQETVNNGTYFIQIGAFSQQSSVNKIRQNLKSYKNLFVQNKMKGDVMLHHVRLGPFSTLSAAQKTLDKVHHSGYPESKIIQE